MEKDHVSSVTLKVKENDDFNGQLAVSSWNTILECDSKTKDNSIFQKSMRDNF